MGPVVSRREFLWLGVGAAAWACARGSQTARPSPGAPALVPATTELAVGDRRMSFALLRGNRPLDPQPGSTARVLLRPEEGKAVGPLTARAVSIRLGAGGKEDEGAEVHTIFVFRYPFDRPGVFDLEVTVGSMRATAPIQVLRPDQSEAVRVGQAAVPSDSPTFSDARGVDPICTRTPPCSMHDLTIRQALEARKPAVFVFATPRFCTSRTCGPLVDIVESVKGEIGTAASFVHVEIWKSAQVVGKEPSPTVSEWKLQTDPWVYFVRPDGIVADRWSGPAGRDELRGAVRDLIAGTL